MLWHVPGGPLPLLVPSAQDTLLKDPFAGWQELEPGRDRTVPYFSPGWPSTLLLKLGENRTLRSGGRTWWLKPEPEDIGWTSCQRTLV
jgi:hypothetical protein